jgi:hypothetical protein
MINSKINFKGTGCDGVDWINVAQDMTQWHVLVN